MRSILKHIWYEAVSSFLFLPLLTLLGAVALYFITSFLNKTFPVDPAFLSRLIEQAGIETYRTVLATIAGSMVTIAGLVVPITIVVLQLSSQQYSSSLVRAFMRDRLTQVSLGIFFATFIFSLLSLTQLPLEDNEQMPWASILTAIFLSSLSIVILIMFIHRIAKIILPYNITSRIAADLRKTSKQLFKKEFGKGVSCLENLKNADDFPSAFESEAHPVAARYTGYIERIDYKELVEIADRYNLMIRLEFRPGEFLLERDTLALVWSPNRIDDRLIRKIAQPLVLGNERTVEMDIDFPLEQMLEMVAKSLSEVTNEVFTASSCLDWLEDSFMYMLRNPQRLAKYFYRNTRLRLITKPFKSSDLIRDAFQICWNSAKNYPVLMPVIAVQMLKIIARLACNADVEDDRQVLRIYARAISNAASENDSLEEHERQQIQEEYYKVIKIFSGWEMGTGNPESDTGAL